MKDKIADDVMRTGHQVASLLDQIARLFKTNMKLTLLVRSPDNPGRNAYFSDEDDMEPVVEALRQLRNNPTGGKTLV